MALVLAERGVRRLHAVNGAAAALGLHVGQKAADASALVPGLVVDDADPQGDDAALEKLVDWCCRFSPAVAKDAPDGLFLDIDGVSHLWGGEEALIDDLLARLESQGIPGRAALAPTAGAAWALARFGVDGAIIGSPSPLRGSIADASSPVTLAPRGRGSPRSGAPPHPSPSAPPSPPSGEGIAVSLSNLPVAALRLDEQDAAQLVRLGATRIEHLTALPRAGLARRFGKMALVRLDQALGAYPEALKYRRPPTPWFERLALVEPISTPDDIARVAADLAVLICERLARSEEAARRFEFAFHRLDGACHVIDLGLSRPGREPKVLTRLIGPKLAEVDPGFGIEIATVSARQVERRPAGQIALSETESEAAQASVAALIDSLSNRLGEGRVWRSTPHQSHVPERAVKRAPAGDPVEAGWDGDLPRPVRLFRRPEPIEVTAPLPDDPPILFRWRGRLHRVRLSEGPERIGNEWWRRRIETVSTDQIRDYYRVEDETGGRYWVFRAGPGSGLGGSPKWWLHGVFG